MGVERGQKVTLSGAKCTSEEVLGRPLAARGQREMGWEALEPQTWARRAGPGGRQWGPSRGSPEGLGTPPTPHWSRRPRPRLAGPSGLLGLTLTPGAGFTRERSAGPVCVCAAALVMSVPAQQREVTEQAAPSRLAAPSATPRAPRKSWLPCLALSPEGSVDGRMDMVARGGGGVLSPAPPALPCCWAGTCCRLPTLRSAVGSTIPSSAEATRPARPRSGRPPRAGRPCGAPSAEFCSLPLPVWSLGLG